MLDAMSAVRQAPGPLRLVQDFVNTLDLESGHDELARTWGLQDWLRERGLLAAGDQVGEDERRRAVEVREALRQLLLANGGEKLDPAVLEVLGRASRAGSLELRFVAGGGAVLEPAEPGVAGALARILAVVHAAMLEGSWARLK